MRDIVLHVYPDKVVNLNKLEEAELDVVNIAHSLSLQCRYTGHTSRMYSVAEHSLYVSEVLGLLHDKWSGESNKSRLSSEIREDLKLTRSQWQLAGLCHDFTEAFVGDVAEPIKVMLPEYKNIENEVESVLRRIFDYDYDVSCCHQVDKTLPFVEMDLLLPFHEPPIFDSTRFSESNEILEACLKICPKLLTGMTSKEAEEQLIDTYKSLWKDVTNSST